MATQLNYFYKGVCLYVCFMCVYVYMCVCVLHIRFEDDQAHLSSFSLYKITKYVEIVWCKEDGRHIAKSVLVRARHPPDCSRKKNKAMQLDAGQLHSSLSGYEQH